MSTSNFLDQETRDAILYCKMIMFNAVADACPILPTVLLRMVAEHLDWWETIQRGDLVDYHGQDWQSPNNPNRKWLPAQVGCCYEKENSCWITVIGDGATWNRVIKKTRGNILPRRAAVLALLYSKNI